MLRILGSFSVLALLAGMAGVASAQSDTTPIPLPAKPDFSSMTYLIGTWNCETKSARRPSAAKSTVTYAFDPSGYWLVGTTKSAGVPWYPHASTSVDRMTYDASTKRWVDLSSDDTGGYDFSASDGWSGNTLVWHEVTYSKGNDTATTSDTTVTKVSATQGTFDNTFTTTAGKTVGIHGSCTKT